MGARILDRVAHFWRQVDQTGGPDACWPWLKSCDNHGYGAFWDGVQIVKASIQAFKLTHGYQPKTVRHSCDNPPCCNPAHLLPGTQVENMKDAAERGRMPRREKHWNFKCTPKVVAAIWSRYTPRCPVNGSKALAKELGLCRQHVEVIARSHQHGVHS